MRGGFYSRNSNILRSASSQSQSSKGRVAMLVPYVGTDFFSWLYYFVLSTSATAENVDWFVFHENLTIPAAVFDLINKNITPHVHFINLGKKGMSYIFARRIADAEEELMKDDGYNRSEEAYAQRVAQLVKGCEEMFGRKGGGYMLADYKPTFGWIFAEYLQPKEGVCINI